jgi:Spy/CpxP family protein refolding chaperone
MKAKTKKILILTSVISLVCFTSSLFAQPSEDEPQAFKEKRKQAIEDFTEELNLTAEQQEQIKNQRAEQVKENKQIQEQLRSKNQELRKELEKNQLDQAKLNSLIAEITDLQGQQLRQRVDGVASMKEILTPEQEAQLKAKMDAQRQEIRHAVGQRWKEGGFKGFRAR